MNNDNKFRKQFYPIKFDPEEGNYIITQITFLIRELAGITNTIAGSNMSKSYGVPAIQIKRQINDIKDLLNILEPLANKLEEEQRK